MTITLRRKRFHLIARSAKVAHFPLVRMILALATLAALMAVGAMMMNVAGVTTPAIRALTAVVTVHVGYVLYVRTVERRPVIELEARSAAKGVAVGFAGGVLLLGLAVTAFIGLGLFQMHSGQEFESIAVTFVAAATAAYTEEIVFRGVVYRLVEELLGTWLGLAAAAVVFGLMHLGNPGTTLVSALAVGLEAGLLLGAVYVTTRRLWTSIGVHLGWNFAQGGLLGMTVSGVQRDGIVSSALLGPDWLTGGAFGIEASPIAVVVCLFAAVVLLRIAVRRSLIVRPYWRRCSITQTDRQQAASGAAGAGSSA